MEFEEELKLSKLINNVPIGELHNIHSEYGLDVDVVNEEIVLLETNLCPHLNVARLLNGTFVCLQCQDTRDVSFGNNIV